MRKLSEVEILSIGKLLKMEKDGLAVLKSMQSLISDDELKKLGEAGVLAAEAKIKGVLQFINENQLLGNQEVR